MSLAIIAFLLASILVMLGAVGPGEEAILVVLLVVIVASLVIAFTRRSKGDEVNG